MYNPHDTICAIATAPGESALAIVRLSGREAVNIAGRLMRNKELIDRQAIYCELFNNDGERIDEVITIWYKGPKSYSGEDLIEIVCHGGYVVSNQILTLLRENGARLAEPGEFTLRAFLNGRIDLTRAEAVNSVINAKTDKAKNLALNNLEGRLGERLQIISSMLIDLITILEAEIDFGDDEVTKLNKTQINDRITEIHNILGDVITTYDIGRVAEGRAKIAIVGAPNVGKSSLFNAILKNTRAIVTDTPGTTRDYLSEYVNIDGYPVILTDTAGIRSSDEEIEEIEKIGIERSRKLLDDADLCLFLLDCSRQISEEDINIEKQLSGKRVIKVINKIDIGKITEVQKNANTNVCKAVQVSAKTGFGIPEILGAIKSQLIKSGQDVSSGVLLSQRQFNSALAAESALKSAELMISNGEHEEVYVGEIREALDQIGIITGKITSEDILNKIFSEFCIGK